MSTDQDSLALSETILAMQAKIKKLEEGNRANRLPNSSVDINTGRGYIPFMDGKVEKGRIGRMPDGTINISSTNNPEAPHIPLPPICEPLIGGVNVTCTGLQGNPPGDFSHVVVYCDDLKVATFTKLPDSIPITPLSLEPHIFQLTSVNLSGTESEKSDGVIATPNQVVSSDVADGIITELKLANAAVSEAKLAADAVTETKIADDAVTTPKIIAGAIQTAQLDAEAVNVDKIAANAITSDKILANAITAIKIAANAIEAGAIKAGAVTADKLEAILVLANRIIAGDPLAARMEISASGLEQRGLDNQLLIQIGSSPGNGQGNVITIIDPIDGTNMLATIASDGTLSCSGLAVYGEFSINGNTFDNIIRSLPWGIQCYGTLSTDSNGTTSRIGLYELSFSALFGRTYKFSSSTFYLKSLGAGFPAGALQIRYTTDGSRPDINSPMLADASTMDEVLQGSTSTPAANSALGGPGGTFNGTNGNTAPNDNQPLVPNHVHAYGTNHTHPVPNHVHLIGGHSHQTQFPQIATKLETLYTFAADCRVRLLFCLQSYYSGNICLDDPDGDAGIQFYVEDIGPRTTSTGGTSVGSGSGAVGGSSFVTTFNPTWNRVWVGTRAGNPSVGLIQGSWTEGVFEPNYSMLGFDYVDIQTQLAGSTITKAELFLYCRFSDLSTGGTLCLGLHNATAIPTTQGGYSYIERSTVKQSFARPQGIWVDLPLTMIGKILANTAKGFVLDHRAESNPNDAGYRLAFSDTASAVDLRPQLRLTYTV